MIEQREYFEMFEKNPIPQLILDRNLVIEQVNKAFCDMAGHQAVYLTGMPYADIRNKGIARFLEDTGQSLSDAVRLKQMTIGNSRIETRSGRFVLIRTNIPLFSESGEISRIYIIYNDITKVVKNHDYMTKVIGEYQKVYARAAEGDLTLHYDPELPDEDTRATYDQLMLLRDAVRGIINSLKTNLTDVNAKMLDLTTNIETTRRTIGDAEASITQIARNTEDVSDKARQSLQGIEEIARAMQDMSATVEEITSSIESVSAQANDATKASKNGAYLLDKVNEGMTRIEASTTDVYSVVEDIARQMGDISKIIVLIRDLANQTNLLALNAAIEAARAGEHGRGFAVVATEVKSLAQESRASAERIEEMITSLNSSTMKAIDAMQTSKTLVAEGIGISEKALTAFREIETSTENVAKSATEVASAAEEQAATTEEITASSQEVMQVIKVTAGQAVDIAAATQESSAALGEITKMAEFVGDVAKQAMEANHKFRVS